MALPFDPNFIPERRRGCEALIDSLVDVEQLNPEQIAAIRLIYALDDDRSVAERMKAGDLDE